MEFDDLSNRVIGCAIEVHRELGPGLLESTYEQCLAHELTLNGIAFQLQHPQPVQYKRIRLDCGYRFDLPVENELIVELKSVEEIKGIHEAQLLTQTLTEIEGHDWGRPDIEGDLYPGDLLSNVLRIAESFWNTHPGLRDRLLHIVHVARDITDDADLGALCTSFVSRWKP